MSIGLKERLDAARAELEAARAKLDGSSKNLPSSLHSVLASHLELALEFGRIGESIDARDSARKLLERVDSNPSPVSEERVVLHGVEMEFAFARRICIQAYVAAEWSLVDQVCSAAGEVLCISPQDRSAKNKPVRLLTHFLGKGHINRLSNVHCDSFSQMYGWPAAVSNSIRNVFVHEGGERKVGSFFASSSVVSGFSLSEEGAQHVAEAAEASLEDGHAQFCPSVSLDVEAGRDLRRLLWDCESDVDSALGALVLSATGAIANNVQVLTG